MLLQFNFLLIQCSYFTPWQKTRVVEEYELEDVVARITGQSKVPFGDAVLDFKGIRLAPESCEELFTAAAPHISYALGAGVEIFTNSVRLSLIWLYLC